MTLSFGYLISFVLGTALWLLLNELLLVRDLCRLSTWPLPEATRGRLRPLADFHLRVATDWALGVALFVLLFLGTPDTLAAIVTTGLAVVGVVFFLVPQLLLARIVQRSHDRACAVALQAWQAHVVGGSASDDMALLDRLQSVTQRPKLWVYGTDELVRWGLAQATAVVALLAQVQQGTGMLG